jgi:four helix bundle protein
VRSYRDLKVWHKAMDLAVESYRLSKLLPRDEVYGLVGQIRRAAVSLPANIAEGHGRDHLGDYLHHLSVVNGSLMELETHLLIAKRLGYFTEDPLESVFKLTSEVGRMLSGLKRGLRNVNSSRQRPNT